MKNQLFQSQIVQKLSRFAQKTSVFGNDLSLVVGTAVLAYSVRHHELSAV
jgi:hypothetical protein